MHLHTVGVMALCALLFGCEDGTPPPASPSLPAEPAEPDTPVASPPADPGAPAPEEPPADCPFRVEGTCYPDSAAACQAAGCAPDGCRIMETYPAQVACDPPAE